MKETFWAEHYEEGPSLKETLHRKKTHKLAIMIGVETKTRNSIN